MLPAACRTGLGPTERLPCGYFYKSGNIGVLIVRALLFGVKIRVTPTFLVPDLRMRHKGSE